MICGDNLTELFPVGQDGQDRVEGHRFCRLSSRHLDAVLRLEAACFAVPWTKVQYLGMMDAGLCRLFGACGPSGLAAYVAAGFYPSAGEVEIFNIAVEPEERGRGLARRLLGLVLRAAGQSGFTRAVLEVRAGNVPAIKLYEGLGFTRCGLRRGYYSDNGEDALVYECVLPRG